MVKKILIALFVVIVAFLIYFFKKYSNNLFVPYNPQGPSYQTEELSKEAGDPVQQLDQAADAIRKNNIENLELALRRYYSANNMPPETLENLVRDGYIKSIKLDKVTNQAPKYYPNDPQYACRVESTLSDGSTIYGYCK